MQIIPVTANPNQSFSVVLDNNQWDFKIQYANQNIAVSLTLNGTVDIEALRAVAGMRIIPSEYEEAGNFVFVTTNQQITDYTQFGTQQQLVYLSAAELAAIRVPPPSLLTPAYFDPLAALPLRLFPQGYQAAGSLYVDEIGEHPYVTESGSSFYITG